MERTFVKRGIFMIYTTIEDYVKRLYHDMGVSEPNQIDMKAIASCLDIKLRFWEFSNQALMRKEETMIFLNENLNSQERWQEFAHELCHVLQDEGYQLNLPKSFVLYQEVKADNFMYHFCVPTFMLEQYQLANYFNIEDGVPIIARDFNVTEEFARKRLIHYRNKLQQAKSDQEHREFMQRLYPKAPPYSKETNQVLDQLNALLMKKGVKG